MEIISFEKKTFEEISAKLDYFVQRMETLCNSHDQKETGKWMDSHSVCRKLRVSPRTLQTFRDNGTLAFTKIGNRTYYRNLRCGRQTERSQMEKQEYLTENIE